MAKSHVAVGFAAWAAAAPMLHLPLFDPACLALVLVGSLLPDVDHPASWVGRRVKPVSTIAASVLGHRGITHSMFAMAGMAALLMHAGTQSGNIWPLVIGYASHLAADMLTPKGLRLAWPLPGTWGIPLCRTGSPMEAVVVFALVHLAGWWTFAHGSDRAFAELRHWFGGWR